MSFIRIGKRVDKLERSSIFVNGRCNCRREQLTFYHSAADLERIMTLHCPVHGVRELGRVSWVPSGTPLIGPDRDLCSCRPSPAREWREGRRGPLTAEEWEEECRSGEEQLSTEAIGKFQADQTCVRQLLQQYRRMRRNQNGTMSGNNQVRRTL
jgi:hypothetical protein